MKTRKNLLDGGNNMKLPITDRQLDDLKKIDGDVLVSRDSAVEGAVNIRDAQFTDFVRAAKYLQHIRENEDPGSFYFLIG